MLQTHADFDQAESERLAHAIEQIDITQQRNERLERENERLQNVLSEIRKESLKVNPDSTQIFSLTTKALKGS